MSAKTLIEKYTAIQAIGTEVEIPFHVWSLLSSEQRSLTIVGNEVSLGEDYASLENTRAAVEWYAVQLGGTIKWPKNKETK